MTERIDPDNPSTVPAKYRDRINAAASRLAGTIEGDETGDGVRQMLCDLLALAVNDGCVSAGWAFRHIAGEGGASRATVAKVNKLRTPEQRAGVVYVGRQFAGWPGTEFGNYGRLSCPGEYRAWLKAQPHFRDTMARLWALTGAGAKPLGCWCLDWDGTGETPACHAAVLAELLNEEFAAAPPAEGGAS